MSFDNDTQTKTYDAPPSNDDLVAFLKPFRPALTKQAIRCTLDHIDALLAAHQGEHH
ncbi:hypothetical protein [Mycolicibacterium hodleri]|uniref:hypothetical protein n=1 Tax=Mycolicibacterium hodleri TaxID=49897 RepID=UPI0013755278|nr:hypothetical protein [Mycolicibacterium hodleri]